LLAQKSGWHVKGKKWLCRECYQKEHGLEAERETHKQMLDRVLAAAKAKLNEDEQNDIEGSS